MEECTKSFSLIASRDKKRLFGPTHCLQAGGYCWGKLSPIPFKILLADLRLKMDIKQNNRRKSNNSLITYIPPVNDGRDTRKLSDSPKWPKPSH